MGTIRYHTVNCVLGAGEPPPRPLAAKPFLLREGLEASSSQLKLLDRLRLALGSRHCSQRTEKTYLMLNRGGRGVKGPVDNL